MASYKGTAVQSQKQEFKQQIVIDEIDGNLTVTGNIVAAAATSAGQVVSKAQVDQSISDVIGGAPELLDTLNELSQAIGDDANFITTIQGEITTTNNNLTTTNNNLANTDAVVATKLTRTDSLEKFDADLTKINIPASTTKNAIVKRVGSDDNDVYSDLGYANATDSNDLSPFQIVHNSNYIFVSSTGVYRGYANDPNRVEHGVYALDKTTGTAQWGIFGGNGSTTLPVNHGTGDTINGDEAFGHSLACTDTQLFVGAPGQDSNAGAVYVFDIDTSGFTFNRKISNPNSTYNFGATLQVTSQYLIISQGAYTDTMIFPNIGSTDFGYIHKYNLSDFSLAGSINLNSESDWAHFNNSFGWENGAAIYFKYGAWSGWEVQANDSYIAVGVPSGFWNPDGTSSSDWEAGRVYVYNTETLSEVKVLNYKDNWSFVEDTAGNPFGASPSNNVKYFGKSLHLDGDILLIGMDTFFVTYDLSTNTASTSFFDVQDPYKWRYAYTFDHYYYSVSGAMGPRYGFGAVTTVIPHVNNGNRIVIVPESNWGSTPPESLGHGNTQRFLILYIFDHATGNLIDSINHDFPNQERMDENYSYYQSGDVYDPRMNAFSLYGAIPIINAALGRGLISVDSSDGSIYTGVGGCSMLFVHRNTAASLAINIPEAIVDPTWKSTLALQADLPTQVSQLSYDGGAKLVGSGSTLTATGDISAGDPVALLSDGTVQKVLIGSDIVDAVDEVTMGYLPQYSSSHQIDIDGNITAVDTTYDTTNNRTLVFADSNADPDNLSSATNLPIAFVTDMTTGSPVTGDSVPTVPTPNSDLYARNSFYSCFDPVENQVIYSYKDFSDSSANVYFNTATIDPADNSVTIGTRLQTTLSAAGTGNSNYRSGHITYIPGVNRILYIYTNHLTSNIDYILLENSSGTLSITGSGTVISQSNLTTIMGFNASAVKYTKAVWDEYQGQVAITGAVNTRVYGAYATVTATALTYLDGASDSTSLVADMLNHSPDRILYFPDIQQVAVLYYSYNAGKMRLYYFTRQNQGSGLVSFNHIEVPDAGVGSFNVNSYISGNIGYSPLNKSIIGVINHYYDGDGDSTREFYIRGISFGFTTDSTNPRGFKPTLSGSQYFTNAYITGASGRERFDMAAGNLDVVSNKFLVFYDDFADNKVKLLYTGDVSANNVHLYYGIAGEDILDGASGTILNSGDVSTDQTGLVTGSIYYLNGDGSLTTTNTSNALVGKALSPTSIQISSNADLMDKPVPVSKGGTGLSSLGSPGQFAIVGSNGELTFVDEIDFGTLP